MTKVDLKSIHARLLKVAQDELDLTKKMPMTSPTGDAGPQEVIDALADVAEELNEVMAIIPAEPSDSNDDDAVDDPDLSEDNKPEPPVAPKEKELMAKIAELTLKVDNSELDKVANKIAELYEDGQAKYDSIMSSGKDSKFWSAQHEALTDFVKNGKQMKTHEAQTVSKYFKVAQQLGNTETRKMI